MLCCVTRHGMTGDGGLASASHQRVDLKFTGGGEKQDFKALFI